MFIFVVFKIGKVILRRGVNLCNNTNPSNHVTHVWVNKQTIITSDNSFSSVRRLAIIQTSAWFLLVVPSGRNSSENRIGTLHNCSQENAFEDVVWKMAAMLPRPPCVNTLMPRQNGRLFADDTFKRIFMNGNIRISIKISLKLVPKGSITNNPALVLIMAWRRPGDKPLYEPMLVRSLTHLCVTQPQWVNKRVSDLHWGDIWRRFCLWPRGKSNGRCCYDVMSVVNGALPHGDAAGYTQLRYHKQRYRGGWVDELGGQGRWIVIIRYFFSPHRHLYEMFHYRMKIMQHANRHLRIYYFHIKHHDIIVNIFYIK